MKTVAVFYSDRFSTAWPVEGGDPNEPPLGRDCAEYLQKHLDSYKDIEIRGEVTRDEMEWVVHTRAQGVNVLVCVMWAPIGEPPTDAWVIQVLPFVPIMARILGRKNATPASRRVTAAIDDILSATPDIRSLQWMSMEEFSKIY